jgi:hypothetical protein
LHPIRSSLRYQERTMAITERRDENKRRKPADQRDGNTGKEKEPGVGDAAEDLDDDQADSGPDRDHEGFDR